MSPKEFEQKYGISWDEYKKKYLVEVSHESIRTSDERAIEQLFLDCGYSGEEGREIL